MGTKVFIPIIKKKYTVSTDTTILLYPFQSGDFGMKSQMFYGKVDSNGELIADFSVDCMSLDMFNRKKKNKEIITIDHFILSSKKEKLEHAPQTPEKLQSFDPEGEVYVIVSNNLFDNEKVVAWTPPNPSSRIIIPSVPKRTEFILKRCDDQLPLFDEYVEKVRRCQDVAWNEAKKLRHFGEHMVEKYVPIEYTIPAGSEFILHLLELKSRISPLNATRCFRLSKIFIDKKEILIMQSDLAKFELEEAPLRRKRKPKV